ncbi:MAG: extracellular solute-binding protein [Clostridia bacterium]|nr:extracellular solute-binding protein [Clostridia bacterium]
MTYLAKRAAALLLCLSLLFSVSCAAQSPTADTTAAPSESAEETAAPDAYDTIRHDVKYDGRTFSLLLTGNSAHTPNDFDSKDGITVMQDAIYRRNLIMEEQYGVALRAKESFGSGNVGVTEMNIAYSSGESPYDLCILGGYDAASLAKSGMLLDLSVLSGVDFSHSWWDQAAVRDLTIAGSLFFTNGALSSVVDDFTFCTVFNKGLFREIVTDGTDLYRLAAEGKWTTEELARVSALVREDLNGDTVMDSRDMYGLMIWDDELLGQFHAAGERIASVNSRGEMEMTMNSERANSILSQFVQIGNSDYCINFQHMTGGVAWYTMFTQDQVLFLMTMFNELSRFRDMQTDYGILPNPKFDENQEWFAPVAPWHCSFICASYAITDREMTGYIAELLGYHSEKLLTPAYYEKTLHGTYVRDEESSAMLDIIFPNRVYDLGHIYRIASLQETITNMLRSNRPEVFPQICASTGNASSRIVEQINESFFALKETNK